MQSTPLRFGIVGCGARGRHVVRQFLAQGGGRVAVAAAFDPDPAAVDLARGAWGGADFEALDSAEAVAARDDVDVVMVFSPNANHCGHILAGLRAGKRVFSEKPLATTLEDCLRVREAEKAAGCPVLTGFVLRYSPFYRKIKELLDSGTFGGIVSLAASENREADGGGNSMSSTDGWRRFRSKAGPYLLEKCCHDLDLINWYAGRLPDLVAAFGGLDFFIPKNAALWDKLDHDIFARHVPEEKRINPFLSEKDIYDNHSVILRFPGGMQASFQLTLANAIPERRMYIACEEGTIIGECFSGAIRYKRYTDGDVTTTLQYPGGGHGGGDPVMVREILAHLLDGAPLDVSGTGNGLDCALVALAADESMRTGRFVPIRK